MNKKIKNTDTLHLFVAWLVLLLFQNKGEKWADRNSSDAPAANMAVSRAEHPIMPLFMPVVL